MKKNVIVFSLDLSPEKWRYGSIRTTVYTLNSRLKYLLFIIIQRVYARGFSYGRPCLRTIIRHEFTLCRK